MWTAKRFGMKVTRYFAGFGPTLFSFRRGETEYGLKAIPLGGFVKIVGMTPQEEEEEELSEEDKKRVMWRKPVWQRTIVLSAGSAVHFILAFVIMWIAAMFVGLPNPAFAKALDDVAKHPRINVAKCVVVANEQRDCNPGTDPASPAKNAGLRDGDTITKVNGTAVTTYLDLVKAIRATPPGPATLTVTTDGAEHTVTVDLISAQRTSLTEKGKTETVSALGVGGYLDPGVPTTMTYGPVDGIGAAGSFYMDTLGNTFTALKKFPEKLPKLWDAVTGSERDPETPISVVGASRIGGELADRGLWSVFLWLLASLNIFVGIFNLLPLLPLDGGHIAVAWFERARSWFAARRGRPDPGRVDYAKLMPVTYVVIIVFGAFTLLTVGADIFNPITLK
ncbi:membrane-associated protease RseP (regulator of RpoE activity) [Longispora fulva]|uniref:Membrane-associated protease RseP (Regulator of RpoE activity) n=2 Tax=Longispora fulva TaxID=619741 RepID=A0A8J7KR47_9ACTN|nr:membrane-associated protease RseP (regulator of RpoE activity) [Longispora fulva]